MSCRDAKITGSSIVGTSATIRHLQEFIKMASNSESNVLILGDTGVGKELTARGIHSESARKNRPFIKINCLCLNENLIESELFGHKKGAFTGALIDRPGLIESSDGGTVFFDEIGDISPLIQGKILSVIEEKEIRRIGENNIRKVNARFIFATNRDLDKYVANNKFREDLFYRISVLSIYIDPIRKRKEDIPVLINMILCKLNEKRTISRKLSREAIKKICNYDFPGNVRELENILKRAYDLSNASIIGRKDIVFGVTKVHQNHLKERGNINKARVNEALAANNGNKMKAAKQLGISRIHLYRLLKKTRDWPHD